MTAFGPIVNDVAGMGATHELIGGKGTCHWKQLINGRHLTGPWNCVEYVVLPPSSSCGEHVHRAGAWGSFSVLELAPAAALNSYSLDDRDEVLFVNRGEARLHFGEHVVDGSRGLCAGIPPGTPRIVENRSATQPLELLSAEVYANGAA